MVAIPSEFEWLRTKPSNEKAVELVPMKPALMVTIMVFSEGEPEVLWRHDKLEMDVHAAVSHGPRETRADDVPFA